MTAARFYSSTAGAMTLTADITALSSSMNVNTTVGLPGTTPFVLVLDPGGLEEIVDVTGVSGTTLTITRGVDSSAAQAHSAGITIRHMATARDFRDIQNHIGNTAGIHGVAGAVVGTTDTQALTNKDLTGASNLFPTSLATTSSLNAHTAATAAHGTVGAVVGTTDTQTLTNKTIYSTNLPQLIQRGSVVITVATNNNSVAVTFPVAFAGTPMVFVSMADSTTGSQMLVARSYNTTATGTLLAAYTGNFPANVPATCSVTVNWMAVY